MIFKSQYFQMIFKSHYFQMIKKMIIMRQRVPTQKTIFKLKRMRSMCECNHSVKEGAPLSGRRDHCLYFKLCFVLLFPLCFALLFPAIQAAAPFIAFYETPSHAIFNQSAYTLRKLYFHFL